MIGPSRRDEPMPACNGAGRRKPTGLPRPVRSEAAATGPVLPQSGRQCRAKVLRYRYGLGARQEISASISAFTSRHGLPASRS